MSNMEISKVLSQMRALAGSMDSGQGIRPPAVAGSPSFGDAMAQAIRGVSGQQQAAQAMVRDFEAGTSSASVAEVMVAMQKSSVAFTAMTQVRNRLVEAYQEIKNMPI